MNPESRLQVSEWASARFTTALFAGFDASPIWLGAQTPRRDAGAVGASVVCDVSGEWKGNGGGAYSRGVPITITQTGTTGAGARNYMVHSHMINDAWTNSMWDLGNGTLILDHVRVAPHAYGRKRERGGESVRVCV